MSPSPELWIVRAGLVPYEAAFEAQTAIAAARRDGEVPDVVLTLEHPPVLTKGRRTATRDLPMGEDWYRMQGIAVHGTDRGGQVTYHGPGQLVAYPIVDLRPGGDVVGHVRALESVMLGALGETGIPAQIFAGLTGVWTAGEPPLGPGSVGPQRAPVGEATLPGGEARKIGSIGVHVSHGVTTHGLAINVNNDLQPFEWIVPCGIEGCRMTSVSRELGGEREMGPFVDIVVAQAGAALARRAVEVSVSELIERVPAAGTLGNAAAVALGGA